MNARHVAAAVLASVMAAACAAKTVHVPTKGPGLNAATPGVWNCVMVISVAGAQTPQPQPARCPPDRQLLIVFQNFTDTDYVVQFDTDADIAARSDLATPVKDLIKAGKTKVNPKAGDMDTLKLKLSPASAFGAGKLAYTTYKFVFHITWTGGSFDLDPDLDVPPS